MSCPLQNPPAAPHANVFKDTLESLKSGAPWYELVGFRHRRDAGPVDQASVENVLSANITSGDLDASNRTILLPVLEVLPHLVEVSRTSNRDAQDVVELVSYCVYVVKCVVDLSRSGSLPQPVKERLDELSDETMAIGRLFQVSVTPKGCCWRKASDPHDDEEIEDHMKTLQGFLELVVNVSTALSPVIVSMRPPTGKKAEVPIGAPDPPPSYVKRAADEGVVLDLVNPERSASHCHCIWGMAGAGKTLLAASIVRDERVLSRFRKGVFWVSIGIMGKGEIMIRLRQLGQRLRRSSASSSDIQLPDIFRDVDQAIRRLRRARGGSRYLVVLDDVWHEEIVEAFALAGFHLLVTTRRKSVVPSKWCGKHTEVREMTLEEAFELLTGVVQSPIPPFDKEEAKLVVEKCNRLPFALDMAGRMAREGGNEYSAWRNVFERLPSEIWRMTQTIGDEQSLFTIIHKSYSMLSSVLKDRFKLLAVVAPATPLTESMLASLWETENKQQVRQEAGALVDQSLLCGTSGTYSLQGVILDYLHVLVKLDPKSVERAIMRQARYLVQPNVLHEHALGRDIRGGLYSLVAQWTAIRRLNPGLQPDKHYEEKVNSSVDTRYWDEAGVLIRLLGKYYVAESIFRRLLNELQEKDSDLQLVSRAMNDLGISLQAQGKYDEAESLYRQAIDGTNKAEDTKDPNLAAYIHHLAGLLSKQGRYLEAEEYYRRATEITKATIGTDNPDYAFHLLGLASLMENRGKYKDAEVQYRDAVDIAETTFSPDHPMLSTFINSLAGLLTTQGSLEEAEPLFRRALMIAEMTLGKDHPSYAAGQMGLATIMERQGEYSEAKLLYNKALKTAEDALGEDNPNTATFAYNLAGLFMKQGAYQSAESQYRHAMAITENALGVRHPEYAVRLMGLARSLEEQGHDDEAKPLYQRALGIIEAKLGQYHPSMTACANNFGTLLTKQGEYGKAEALHLRSVAITEETLGGTHPDYAARLMGLAGVKEALGESVEAERLCRQAMEIIQDEQGDDHPDIAAYANNLGRMLFNQGGDWDEAENLYRRAMKVAMIYRGREHPHVATYANNLGELLKKKGKREEAKRLLQRATYIAEISLGANHPSTALYVHNLAVLQEEP